MDNHSIWAFCMRLVVMGLFFLPRHHHVKDVLLDNSRAYRSHLFICLGFLFYFTDQIMRMLLSCPLLSRQLIQLCSLLGTWGALFPRRTLSIILTFVVKVDNVRCCFVPILLIPVAIISVTLSLSQRRLSQRGLPRII